MTDTGNIPAKGKTGMFELSVQTHFSAAHHLRGYAGTCADQHGHNWQVEVCLRGEELDQTGMLVDFREMKRGVKTVIDKIDHKDLNRLPFFEKENPTSEAVARFLFRELDARLNIGSARISRVTVHETAGTSASYWE